LFMLLSVSISASGITVGRGKCCIRELCLIVAWDRSVGKSIPGLFSFMGIRPKCAALLPQHAVYRRLWFNGIWRTVVECPAGPAGDGDFLRFHQKMVRDKNGSDCCFPAWN